MSVIPSIEHWRRSLGDRPEPPLAIGLVNNMPDAALRSTERQFRELLAEAAGPMPITLRVFSLPGLSRSAEARRHMRDCHEDIARLWTAAFDGVIVTGTEPRAPDLADEPYWPMVSRLVQWASANTVSSIWSCLAAHAAVRCLDGIEREAMPGKLSGVFDCETVAEHRLLRGADEPWRAPHSRCNGLREADLRARGYRIVTRAGEAGVDMFVKRRGSLFVFLQSHPEYDAGALYREYRRDVGRFLAGERRVYPEIPSPYLDAEATARLLAFRARVTASGHPNLMAEFPAIAPERHLLRPWRRSAVKLYANWLRYLDERRAVRAGAVWNRVTSLTKPDGVAAVV